MSQSTQNRIAQLIPTIKILSVDGLPAKEILSLERSGMVVLSAALISLALM